jgi:hypothetical protein
MKWKKAKKIKKCCKLMQWCCKCKYNSFCYDPYGIANFPELPKNFKKKDFKK